MGQRQTLDTKNIQKHVKTSLSVWNQTVWTFYTKIIQETKVAQSLHQILSTLKLFMVVFDLHIKTRSICNCSNWQIIYIVNESYLK